MRAQESLSNMAVAWRPFCLSHIDADANITFAEKGKVKLISCRVVE